MKFETVVKVVYRKLIRPRIENEIVLQRLKLIWFVWGYLPILQINLLPISQRINLLVKLLRVDWSVLHSHRPCEIVKIFIALSTRRAEQGEVMIEAGCWKGGSSAKFSLLCEMLGYQLLIYDSFQGVESFSQREAEGGYDFSGEYVATQDEVTNNIQNYGEIQVCQLVEGWFSETIASNPVSLPVRLIYIDCDLAKGTYEVLLGGTPSLVEDAVIFTQDYHIQTVRELLASSITWDHLQKPFPKIKEECGNLASISWRA